MFDIIFTNEPLSDYRSTLAGDVEIKGRFRNLLQEEGVFQGPQKFYPSLAHTSADIEQTIKAFERVLDKLQE